MPAAWLNGGRRCVGFAIRARTGCGSWKFGSDWRFYGEKNPHALLGLRNKPPLIAWRGGCDRLTIDPSDPRFDGCYALLQFSWTTTQTQTVHILYSRLALDRFLVCLRQHQLVQVGE